MTGKYDTSEHLFMSIRSDNKGLTLIQLFRLAGFAVGHAFGVGPLGIANLPDPENQHQNENTQFQPDAHGELLSGNPCPCRMAFFHAQARVDSSSSFTESGAATVGHSMQSSQNQICF
ncbi:MAG: hypothetical protein LW719_10480 [Comamonadaceae bacterium]|nr:hypothetical protein [Comamonadaceae bacterium]